MKLPLFCQAAILLFIVVALGQQSLYSQSTSRNGKDARKNLSRRETENIVRDYLLKHPEIIREALAELDAKEAKERSRQEELNLKSKQREIFSVPEDPFAGNPKGDISIAIFFDYNCGYCKKSLPAVSELLSNDPLLRIVYKEFPILGPQSRTATLAALAAGRQGKYLEFYNGLMGADSINDALIEKLAVSNGLNYEIFQRDMKDPKLSEIIANNYALANALNITGTPSYILQDQIIPGAIDAAALSKLIEDQRAKNKASQSMVTTSAPRK